MAQAAVIDGKALAAGLRQRIADAAAGLKQRHGIIPGLAAVLVGGDPASEVYVRSKARACAAAGLASFEHRLPAGCGMPRLLELVAELNADERVDGILVQLPLPHGLDPRRVIAALDPAKDVDGFHPVNVGKLVTGDKTAFRPATPYGVQQMLIRSGIETKGAHAVIVGRSNIVGKPMANLLIQQGAGGDATVTVCHSRTRDLPSVTRLADILVAAIGKAEFVTAEMVRPGAVVIDVGINRVDDPSRPRGYRLTGDVAYEPVSKIASAITPVPGGVGPMTIAMLLQNTLQAMKQADLD
jgi:methylenetetrahydrofolate dehydrogenase (NADP+) / methenyltetrahydrofolate cyclohydrolase